MFLFRLKWGQCNFGSQRPPASQFVIFWDETIIFDEWWICLPKTGAIFGKQIQRHHIQLWSKKSLLYGTSTKSNGAMNSWMLAEVECLESMFDLNLSEQRHGRNSFCSRECHDVSQLLMNFVLNLLYPWTIQKKKKPTPINCCEGFQQVQGQEKLHGLSNQSRLISFVVVFLNST